MTIRIAVAAIVVALAAVPARAEDRAGPAALGALSGAVVLGPVGLVAGAVIGYAAGPEIGRSWKIRRGDPRHSTRRAKRSAKQPAHVATRQGGPAAQPAAGVVTPAPGTGGPPAQGFE